MTMREIQDLTLQTERGTGRLDAVFATKRKAFHRWLDIFEGVIMPTNFVGVRASIAPLWPLYAEQIHGRPELFPRPKQMKLKHGSDEIELDLPGWPANERPILRGSRRTSGNPDVVQELLCDGSGEIRFRLQQREKPEEGTIYPDWVLGAASNATAMADAYRTGVGASGAEFALELEIAQQRGDVVLAWHDRSVMRLVGDPFQSPCLFPRMGAGPKEEFGGLVGEIANDLRNVAGLRSWEGPFNLHM
jgi:hypothetical protein